MVPFPRLLLASVDDLDGGARRARRDARGARGAGGGLRAAADSSSIDGVAEPKTTVAPASRALTRATSRAS